MPTLDDLRDMTPPFPATRRAAARSRLPTRVFRTLNRGVPAKIDRMRIGTWNLEGKWSPAHLALMDREHCDVWLLTEVHIDASIPGMQVHRTAELMGPRKTWAAIFSTSDLEPQPDPHRATALAHVDGLRLMSSVLPWRSCGPSWPGSTLAEKQRATLDVLRLHLDETTIWGGDWNQALEGSDYVGTRDGRDQIVELIETARLSVPTRSLRSASPGHRSIDHIAVPMEWDVDGAYRVPAQVDGYPLSDHEAYVISVDRGPNGNWLRSGRSVPAESTSRR
jgi:hypothetical protein